MLNFFRIWNYRDKLGENGREKDVCFCVMSENRRFGLNLGLGSLEGFFKE